MSTGEIIKGFFPVPSLTYCTSCDMPKPDFPEIISPQILLTNLAPNVSVEDLTELFGDIGPLERVIVSNEEPHQAIIEYSDKKSIKRAIDVYNNRSLDGKPMKCHLPRREKKSMTEIQSGKKRRFSESESSIDGVNNDPESTIIQLQAQLRNQDIEIEDLKKQGNSKSGSVLIV